MVRRSFVSVFVNDDGRLFLPTARHIWDVLQSTDPAVQSTLNQEESMAVHEQMLEAGEQAGHEFFERLKQEHTAGLAREEERGEYYFESRRKAIEKVGLPEVRQHRFARCDADEQEWRAELNLARQLVPEIRPLLLMRIESYFEE
jgi:hypothetical protein